ncbi:MAG TPA: GGDEF domain-containing protein [Steroidobacter sp.]|uniref:GGDEF domain-containing protein n=1 Tax=Steroidobacter sp. TaxID=1978227 RepID=UPI002EDB33C5
MATLDQGRARPSQTAGFELIAEPAAQTESGAAPVAPQSAYGLQLARGFPRLKFDDPDLERKFRRAHLARSRAQISRNLLLGIGFVVGFSALTHLVLPGPVNRPLDLIRLTVLGPVFLIALLLVHTRLYQRWYPIVCPYGATLFGVGVVVLAVIAASQGVSLIASVVLAIIYNYLMLGMSFRPALGTSLLVLLSYPLIATLAGIPGPQRLVDVGVLLFTNAIGAIVCYSLERANRTNFLESQLLMETARRDGLTGIANRRTFDEHINRVWAQAAREGRALTLLMIDIDHFKAYNDRFGHQAGDECLRRVAWSLSSHARRPLDIAARYGGEEFAMILFDSSRQHAEDMARQIQAGIESLAIAHSAPATESNRLTVSIGIACVQPMSDRSHFGFIQLADEALYAAKERGRNCIVIMDKEYGDLNTGSFRKEKPVAAGTTH